MIPHDLVDFLKKCQRAVVCTGAGISAESGVPTFRDAQTGLWAQYRAEELATPTAFQRNPKLVWEWYAMRRANIQAIAPNAGHFAIVSLAKNFPSFHLITQNVDGLHQRAGSHEVIELHGNIHRVKCFGAGHIATEWADTPVPPRCPHCQDLLRPDVVWFGENLPEKEFSQAFEVVKQCDVLFSIGTSALVEPAASLPRIAKQAGARLVEINLESTPLTRLVDFPLSGKAADILPALVAALG